MNVLVFDPGGAILATYAAELTALPHHVVCTTDAAEARERGTTANIVLVALSGDPAQGLDLVRHLRAAPLPYPYLLVLADGRAEATITAAYEAGCDGDLRLPFARGTLRARLLPAQRLLTRLGIRGTAAAKDARSMVPPVALAKRAVVSPLDVVSRSAAWQAMRSDLQNVARTFLTMNVVLGDLVDDADLHVCRGIALTNTDHELELRVTLGADSRSARALTVHLFGDDSTDLEADMVGELANMSMGALKTAFAKEDLAFTGGLPEPLTASGFLGFSALCPYHDAFTLLVDDARIAVRVGVVSKKNAFVDPSSLCEGMVLAKDVFSPKGMLLLRAGTRISSVAAERLRQALPRNQTIEVAWRTA